MIIQPISKETISAISLYADSLIKELRDKLELQGHNDTGSLSKSIRYEIKQERNSIIVEFYYLDYGDKINDGVAPQNVRYNILDLVDWGKRKNIGGKNATRNELIQGLKAIKAEHELVGIPTVGSARFSKDKGGKRTGFKDDVFKNAKSKIPSFVSNDLIEPLKTMFLDGLKGVK